MASYVDEIFKIIDIYKGNGLDISYLNIKNINNKPTLVIGWKIRDISSNLDLIIYENNQLISILDDKNLYFGKIDILDFNNDGNFELVLWTHDTGLAYEVNIYEILNNKLINTSLYNQIYYPKVLKYYDDLVSKHPTSSTYLYYLSKAQCILGMDISHTTNKMLQLPYPYPPINKDTCN